ncbi:MAG: RraA family protein [Thermomicrobiales bacterium]
MSESSIRGAALTEEMLAFLKSVDSPTIANAIEPFGVRDRSDGYIGGSIQCQFPDLGVMVGRALTVTMTNTVGGPPASRDGYWRMWDALEAMEGPVVLAIADASGAPHRVAYAGEIMVSIAQKLGAVGMVTDGALRDVDEVHALGFHYFMRYPVVSHANFEIVSVGEPIVLDGQRVVTGDLLHGDRNGIVIIHDETLAELKDAVERVRTSERADMDFIRGADFSLAGFKQRKGYGS